ncbi:NAD(P)H-binding protein [Limosilactobacillus caecicola]|uniref:NAD(P)H-binding protein n=1 Tax=Limosilactobacillus caecicola TaxID=2941332 RepID=UPI00203CE3C2|nr:NAD(P)H-binding protein [Limosilactobacillus caecicola]
MKYAVTAATGNFGQTAVKTLNDLVGADNVIAVVRNTEKGNKLFPQNEVRQGDYDNAASIKDALQGVDRVLFISSQPGGKVDRATAHKNVVDALKANDVKFVAYTSYPHAQDAKSPLASDHKVTEDAIIAAGIDHSFLRNNWYLQNEMGFLQSGAANKDALYWANNNAGWALEGDYAEAAAKVVAADQAQEVYEFAGASRSYEDLGHALQEATGNNFAIKQVSQDDYVKYLEDGGLDANLAAMFASFQAPIDSGDLTEDTDDLAKVLGRPVTPIVDAIKQLLA